MNRCSEYEVKLSALLDHELTSRELAPLFDHVLGCGSCQSFYHEVRWLEAELEPIAAPKPEFVATPHPVLRASRSVSRPARVGIRPLTPGPLPELSRRARRWTAVAAMLLVASVGVLSWLQYSWTPAIAKEQPVLVELGEERGKMSDARFVTMAVELLRADPLYHQQMLDVLHEVYRATSEDEGFMMETVRGDRGPWDELGQPPVERRFY